MKQIDLAKLLEITPQHMNDIIKRRRRPSVDLAKRLENITGIDRRAWIWPDDFSNPLIFLPEGHSEYPPNHLEQEGRNHDEIDR